MECGEGMVAVIRGLRNASLAVTLLDGGKQYTLVPNGVDCTPVSSQPLAHKQVTAEFYTDTTSCDNSIQVADGRYASTYKTTHCNVMPSSPLVELTEFPPQRAEFCPGYGNFEVGGSGSRETYYIPAKSNGTYRGRMSWSDRACSPRQSRESDAFANSLRKYPAISPERSAEIVERLINYTQAKNLSRTQGRSPSPNRSFIDSDTSNLTVSERNSRNIPLKSPRNYEDGKPNTRRAAQRNNVDKSPKEDAPTKENRSRGDENDSGNDYRRLFGKNNDVRHLRETSKRVGDSMKSMAYNTNSVDMEIQAAAEMVSKEIATVPRAEPLRRTVAVPLTPTSSDIFRRSESGTLHEHSKTLQMDKNEPTREIATSLLAKDANKSHSDKPVMATSEYQLEMYNDNPVEIPAKNLPINFKSVQTAFSSVDLVPENCFRCNRTRKSKSQEQLNKHEIDTMLQEEILDWFQDFFSSKTKVDAWSVKIKRLAEKLTLPGAEERLRKKIRKYLNKVYNQVPECNDERIEFGEKLSDDIIRKLKNLHVKRGKMRHSSSVRILRIEVPKYCEHVYIKNGRLRAIVDSWLESISLRKRDILGKVVRREDMRDTIVSKLNVIMQNKPESEKLYKHTLKWHVMEFLNKLPVILANKDKGVHLNRIAESLVQNIMNIDNEEVLNKINNENNEESFNFISNLIKVGDKNKVIKADFSIFVRKEIKKLLNKYNLNINDEQIEHFVSNLFVLLRNAEELRLPSVDTQEKVQDLLQDVFSLPHYQAKQGADILKRKLHTFLIKNNKDISTLACTSAGHTNNQNTSQNILKDEDNIKVSANKERLDTETNTNIYKYRIIQEINEWLTKNIDVSIQYDSDIRDQVIDHFADDIIDRHKYLELNQINNSMEDELQELKYQIFKWINKFVGEDNTQTIEHASELMEKINNKSITKLLTHSVHMVPHTSICYQVTSHSKQKIEKSLPYIEKLIEIISDWFYNLPNDLHSSEDMSMRNSFINDLAKAIVEGLKGKRIFEEVIDTEVNSWIGKALRGTPTNTIIETLKDQIKILPFMEELTVPDHKKDKQCIRIYEDIIDAWMDSLSIEPRKETPFIETRNESVHDLAVKLCKKKQTLAQLPVNLITNKLEDMVSSWLKKIPITSRLNRKVYRDQYAANLIKRIQDCNFGESIQITETRDNTVLMNEQLETAVIDWLKSLSLYRDSDSNENNKQEKIMIDLAKEINTVVQRNIPTDIDQIIMRYTNALLMNYPQKSKEYSQYCANQLRLKLDKLNVFGNSSQRNNFNNDLLENNIRNWINNLPIDQANKDIMGRQRTIILNLKKLHQMGEDEKLKNEITKFLSNFAKNMNSDNFVSQQDILLQILRTVPAENVQRKSPQNVNVIRNAIEDWSKKLPLQAEYCPTQLKTLITQMAIEISPLIVHSNIDIYNEKQNQIKCIITEYLQKFPLKPDVKNKHFFKFVSDLWEILKDSTLCTGTNAGNSGESRAKSLHETEHVVNFDNDPVIYPNSSNINQQPKDENKPIVKFKGDDILEFMGTSKPNVNQKPIIGTPGSEGSIRELLKRRLSGPAVLGIPDRPQSLRNFRPDMAGIEHMPKRMTLKEVYEYFDNIFNEKCQELPIKATTSDQKTLAELGKRGMYNGIWKTFFKLKSDSEIENDYEYFEFLFEEHIDKMLDCLPQTLEMQRIRKPWKSKVLLEIINMLKYIHSITDKPSFRTQLIKHFTRRFVREHFLKESDRLHYFVGKIVDDYILYIKYTEENPIKSNIYKQRLMNKLEELVKEIKREHNEQFRFINQAQLCRIAFDTLKSVPIPDNETLTEEANEILLNEEIEEWYSALPVKPLENEPQRIFRRKMKELLSKKLYELEKQVDPEDLSYERNMKHEISYFLEKYAVLESNEDLNINVMVEELANRLKNKRQQNHLSYESFDKDKPVSSTFIQTDTVEPLAVLVDIQPDNHSEIIENNNTQIKNESARADNIISNTIQEIPSKNRRPGVLGTSQIAGPSRQVSFLNERKANRQTWWESVDTSQYTDNQRPYSQHINDINHISKGQEINQIQPYSRNVNYATHVSDLGQEINDTQQYSGPINDISNFGQGINQSQTCSGHVNNVNHISKLGQGLIQTQPCFRPINEVKHISNLGQGINRSQTYSEHVNNVSRTSNLRQNINRYHSLNTNNLSNLNQGLTNAGAAITHSNAPRLGLYGIQVSDTSGQTISQGTSTGFAGSQPSRNGRTVSTVTVANQATPGKDLNNVVVDQEQGYDEEELRLRCRYMERVWRCGRRVPCRPYGRRRPCYPMPFPYGYFY